MIYSVFRLCRDELVNKGVHNIDKEVEKIFAEWFKEHVRHLPNVSQDLRALAFGLDQTLLVHTACNVNGPRFRTLSSEENLCTQNSGVMHIASVVIMKQRTTTVLLRKLLNSSSCQPRTAKDQSSYFNVIGLTLHLVGTHK